MGSLQITGVAVLHVIPGTLVSINWFDALFVCCGYMPKWFTTYVV